MPVLLKSIDKIAREKQRDVLFIRFDYNFVEDFNYKDWPFRQHMITWLKEENIPFYECGDIATDDGLNSYLGQIYLDIIYDVNDPIYQKVANYLETQDGKPKIEGVLFYLVPLNLAMKNSHHDDPDFEFGLHDD